MIVELTKSEHDYLVNVLLKEHSDVMSKVKFENLNEHTVIALLDDITADDIRELAGDLHP
ncbi:MAG: hypothetical protein LBN06_04645 [Prevotellaceae bacterium]|jgi:hypothetical protein|nr:hypothetical protein [Prevotellaceae bacterium]